MCSWAVILECAFFHYCIPSAYANAILAFAAAFNDAVPGASCVALDAIAASLAPLPNMATTLAFWARRSVFVYLACSCLCAAAFFDANMRSASLFAFLSR